MTLTKDHLISSLRNNTGFTKTRSSVLLQSLLEIIKKNLVDGEEVLISGFGKFCVKGKGERKGRNPATGDDMMLGSRRVVTFRCSPVLRDKINKRP
jgi:integration host factor subunit alpha